MDLWLETRSFVEQLDSLLDMVRDSVMIAAQRAKKDLIISGCFGTVLTCLATRQLEKSRNNQDHGALRMSLQPSPTFIGEGI